MTSPQRIRGFHHGRRPSRIPRLTSIQRLSLLLRHRTRRARHDPSGRWFHLAGSDDEDRQPWTGNGQPVLQAGAPLGSARAVAIMVHGRNAGPEHILDLVPRLARPALTYLAPTAANRTWYPQSFMADVAGNEPGLSSALRALESLVAHVETAGVQRSRVVLIGFSQGACLAAEFAVRHASRFGGVIVFSGGVIGPPGTRWDYEGRFEGTPVFLGCSDRDSHVPETRVTETAGVFARMGAEVATRIYPGMGHLINDDEIARAQDLIDATLR